MTKKILLINSDIADKITQYFENKDVQISFDDKFLTTEDFDMVVINGKENFLSEDFKTEKNIIYIHDSLLPSFDEENPIEKAYISGVKVTGVTIFNGINGKILAQYPVLIGLTTSLNELKSEIIAVKSMLVPRVIDTVLNDEVFDFSDLFKSSCHKNNGGCGGCKSCHK